MGWNDHVDFREMECLDCGIVDVWEFWDDVAKERYSDGLDKALGHDHQKADRCPHCGSINGIEEEEED